MNVNVRLPEPVARALAAHMDITGAPDYCVASDLTLDRRFGASYLVVADGKVGVADETGAAFALDIRSIKEVKVDELFGGGALVAVTPDGDRRLITYTKVPVPEFAVMARAITDLAQGKVPQVPDEYEPAYCHRCGAPLPERGATCPRCVPWLDMLKRLLALVQPYRLTAWMLVVTTFITVGSTMLPPLITKVIVDQVIRQRDPSRLPLWVSAMVACAVVYLAARMTSRSLGIWLASRVVADVRARLHTHLQRLRMVYFNRRDSGELVARVMHDTNELQQFLVDGLPFLMVNTVSSVAITIILLKLDVKLAVLVFVPVPFLIFGGGWFWHKLTPMFHRHGSRMALLHTILGESIHGIKTIKASAQERRRSGEFNRANESLARIGVGIENTFVGFFETMFFVMSLGIAGVWFFAARRLSGSETTLTLGDLLAFVGYIWLFYGPLQWFTAVLNWMTHAFSGAERIFSVLDSPLELDDAPGAVALPRARGDISFRDVRFSYERGKEVIKGINLEIASGEMIGLVGKSGAGKSTIINLICRFYDVDSGLITIDGHPIKDVRVNDLRRQIGMVMQEPFLFNGTILDNIRYGEPTASFERVMRAARAARAHEFILEKEDGYDTCIGEGVALSGGEKQRIAIAQAILNDPPILILDEATSSVDSETEKAIQEAIANLIRNRTVIAIAHRLATLRNATRLVVIDDGKIAEMGTHEELVAKDGLYAKLARIQSELNRLKSDVWQE